MVEGPSRASERRIIRNADDARIPDGLNTDQKAAFVKAYNSAIRRGFPAKRARDIATSALKTPEDRAREIGEEDIFLPPS